ncbi:hypothetical protein RB598_000046 [Gaeumannomyces tritici]
MSTGDALHEPKKAPMPEYHFIPYAEQLYRYAPGGYHPVLIGDTLGSRYRVVHKLGYGGFSTTWLCRNEASQAYVAIKVGTADSPFDEYEMLDFLNRPSSKNAPGRSMIPKVLDRFTVEGPNGRHPCIATPPALCSIQEALDEEAPFPIDTARSLAAQLVLALDYIHSRGIVHGDLHLGNLLLCPATNNLDQLTVDELYAKYPLIPTEPAVRHDEKPLGPGIPPHITFSAYLGKLPKDCSVSETKAMVADFGSSYHMTPDSMHKTCPPLGFIAPEAFYEKDRCLSSSSDIWALAGNIWEIFGGMRLFQDAWNPDDDLITWQWVLALGKLPLEWWDKWEARSKYFTEDGEIGPGGHAVWCATSFDGKFVECIQERRQTGGLEILGDQETLAFKAMLRRMLAYRPEERPTAAELLRCEWMVKWALPELRKSPYARLLDGEV